MTYLLDANVFMDFQNASQLPALVAASQKTNLAMVEQVVDEVTFERNGDSSSLVGKKRKAAAALRGAAIATLEVKPATPAAALMMALLSSVQSSRPRDQGEAASIAVASTDPSLIFVTGDRTGTLWALNELYGSGERVMRVPVFIRTLFDNSLLPATAVRAVAERVASHGAVPTWWASWLSDL